MDLDQYPLSCFEVDCDGSVCGSPSVGRHIHSAQLNLPPFVVSEPICRVRIENGERVLYTPLVIVAP